MLKYKELFLLLFLLVGCATFKTQYQDDQITKISSISNTDVEHTFFLIGDAGKLGSQDLVLSDVARALQTAGENSTLLFLGDNVYQKGMPPKSAEDRTEKEQLLNAQLKLADGFSGNTIFIPGNHDWYSGLKGLKRQEKYVEDKLGKDSFLPENGCPFERVKINDNIVMLVIDAQWYITNWNSHPTMNDDCELNTKADFWDEVESEIKKAQGKTTIIAMHKPVISDGEHSGQFTFVSNLKPLPGLGTLKNLLRKAGGVSNADLQNSLYRELSDRLIAYSQFNDKVIFISGHEHSLQYLQRDDVTQIISGSGAKKTATRLRNGGSFTSSDYGFAKLQVLKDGSSRVYFYSSEKKEELFSTEIFSEDVKDEQIVFDQIQETATAQIYSEDLLKKSNFHKWIWGERYRDYYGTEVTVPSIDLSKYLGGLTPIRKGGGTQSMSLHMKNEEGKEYILRGLKKSATQFIQAAAFKEQYVGNSFQDTATEELFLDVFTGAHPYATFIVADLADAIDVLHTNPKLVYVPKQESLGKFNELFGDELYMIEEKVTDGHGDVESFANADEIISTHKVFKEIRKDERNSVDQRAFLRASLFDMVLGDWDRHDDQWKWAVIKEGKKERYVAIPRDRDHVFSKMADGVLMGYLTRAVSEIKEMQNFKEEPKNVKYYNEKIYPLAVAFLQDMNEEDWIAEIEFIQSHLTDDVIDKAFLNFPNEIRDNTMRDIQQTLKQRRDNLNDFAMEFYEIVNKTATITGTDKDDFFDIERLPNGDTKISVYRNKKGEKKSLFHSKTFTPSITNEIWLYGLDDTDEFHVFGESSNIKIRIIGGQNHDIYNIENGNNVKIYDYKSKKSTFTTDKGTNRLTDDYDTNVYDYRKIKYDDLNIFPVFNFSPDNGFMVGPGLKFTKNNFTQNPFSQQHKLNAMYSIETEGVEANYTGEFARVIGNGNLVLDATYRNPYFSKNFFGYGMSAEYNDSKDLDFYRTRVQEIQFKPSLLFKHQYGQSYEIGLTYQNMETQETQDRWIYLSNQVPATAFDAKDFVGAFGRFKYDNKDNEIFPSIAMKMDVEIGYTSNINDSDGSYTYLYPQLGFSHRLTTDESLVLSTMVRAQINSTDETEFYQAASIGGDNGLRGFYNQRFVGKSSFTQSTDIRTKLGNMKTAVLPISYGLYGGFDYGRVWSDFDTSDDWATSYGGGFYINGSELIGLNASYFRSIDGGRIVVGTGFTF